VTPDASRPLCVDLDGTLLKTDTLWELVFQLAKSPPWSLFLMPLWLFRGKAWFKARVADLVDPDPALLPYSETLLTYLREQKRAGRHLVLATAANERPAERIAAHLGLFDRVYASDEHTNLSGREKLRRLVNEFGEQNFDYAGNDRVDLCIWARAAEGILVNPAPGVAAAAARLGKAHCVLRDRPGGVKPFLKAMRIHQWLKNLLVFVPLMLAHRITDPALVAQAVLAFFAFSLCASSVYFLNDLLDLPADRRHPSKRRRPFAAGDIDIRAGVGLMLVLLIAAIGIGSLLPPSFLALLGFYYVTTLAYSLRLKNAAVVDVLVLAGLYTLRILAGGAAVGVEVSFWLLAFSMFFFLSLALVKRFSEMLALQANGGANAVGRDYRTADLETLSQLGTSSGYMAVLVLALYISSEHVHTLYARPELIWLLCPLALYWVSRVWLMARRGEIDEDPVVFAVQDRRTRVLAVLAAAVLVAAL